MSSGQFLYSEWPSQHTSTWSLVDFLFQSVAEDSSSTIVRSCPLLPLTFYFCCWSVTWKTASAIEINSSSIRRCSCGEKRSVKRLSTIIHFSYDSALVNELWDWWPWLMPPEKSELWWPPWLNPLEMSPWPNPLANGFESLLGGS